VIKHWLHFFHVLTSLTRPIVFARGHASTQLAGIMKRIDVETRLNESRNLILASMAALDEEQLRRPITPSEHDTTNYWTALDHFSHLALIEQNFVAMIRRHVAGHENPVGLLSGPEGTARSREQIMAIVHAMTDEYQRDHHDDTLSVAVSLTSRARSETLALLSELSDDELDEPLEGAPWADGTIGGVLGTNADHAALHWRWVTQTGLLD